ncbi:MAG: AlpA family phage regulatory protein [Proteobacteria bacterium]|nr:AlpA family phage regulatory protein [Pseudomonadota bacterium]
MRTGLRVQIVRLPQVLQRRGRGRSAHYEDISKGLFTRPVRIGARAVGWPDYEIDALIAAQVASTPPGSLRQLVKQLEELRATAASRLA